MFAYISILAGKTYQEHINLLEKVLAQLSEAGLRLKKREMLFYYPISYLFRILHR